MSLYEGLDVDTTTVKQENRDEGQKSDLSGWSAGIRLMQSQMKIKKAGLTDAQRRRQAATLAPVVDLKTKAGGNDGTGSPLSILSSLNKPTDKRGQENRIPEGTRGQGLSSGVLGGAPAPLGDMNDEYNPMWPNDYDKIIKERRDQRRKEREQERLKDIEERERRRERREREREQQQQEKGRESPHGFARRPPSVEDEYDEYDRERERDRERDREHRRREGGRGAAIAPPKSLLEEDQSNPSGENYGAVPPPKPLMSLTPAYDDDETDPDTEQPSSPPPPGSQFGEGAAAPRGALLPTPSLNPSMGLGSNSVAAKIMAKYGYESGKGLGKQEQGMFTALEVEKTGKRGGKIIDHSKLKSENPWQSQPQGSAVEAMKTPSKVVLLTNMVGPGEVDADLEMETKEECSKYGEVTKCLIYELPGVPEEEAVRIFLEFKHLPSAIKALIDLNGRYFGGRVVKAEFFDMERFQKLDLAP